MGNQRVSPSAPCRLECKRRSSGGLCSASPTIPRAIYLTSSSMDWITWSATLFSSIFVNGQAKPAVSRSSTKRALSAS